MGGRLCRAPRARGDFELALQGLLGDEAPLSGTTVARLKEKWHAELAEWQTQRPDDLEAVYLWVSVGGWDVCETGARKGESGLTGDLGRVEQWESLT